MRVWLADCQIRLCKLSIYHFQQYVHLTPGDPDNGKINEAIEILQQRLDTFNKLNQVNADDLAPAFCRQLQYYGHICLLRSEICANLFLSDTFLLQSLSQLYVMAVCLNPLLYLPSLQCMHDFLCYVSKKSSPAYSLPAQISHSHFDTYY